MLIVAANRPELNGKVNGDQVTINAKNYRLRMKRNLPAGQVRLIAEQAVDPMSIAGALPWERPLRGTASRCR